MVMVSLLGDAIAPVLKSFSPQNLLPEGNCKSWSFILRGNPHEKIRPIEIHGCTVVFVHGEMGAEDWEHFCKKLERRGGPQSVFESAKFACLMRLATGSELETGLCNAADLLEVALRCGPIIVLKRVTTVFYNIL